MLGSTMMLAGCGSEAGSAGDENDPVLESDTEQME